MNDEEDWIMRPVGAGLCKYESLIDGTLGLFDISRMNEFLDCQAENEARMTEALSEGNRG
jgi:hypothetical protein